MTKRKSKGAYMISSVAEMYGIHPQTLRLYEREGLLKPSRTEGNTRLYTDEDLQRLEFILSLARDLGVNISGMAIILQMRERMEEMQRQIQEFVQYIQQEVLTRATAAADPAKGAIVPVRRPMVVPDRPTPRSVKFLSCFLSCHPERSQPFAKRNVCVVEGPRCSDPAHDPRQPQ